MKINIQNIEKNEQYFKHLEKLSPYVAHLGRLFNKPNPDYEENIINLPFEEKYLVDSMNLSEKIQIEKINYVLIVGIGGSNLTVKAVYDASHGFFDIIEPKHYPKLIFFDTLNSKFNSNFERSLRSGQISKNEVLTVFISKSGNTFETVKNLEFIRNNIKTTRYVSIIGENAEIEYEKGNKILKFENYIGGRFSAFSSVGLFPISTFGDPVEFLTGAMEITKKCLEMNLEENPAINSAINIYIKNKPILDTFVFNSELETLGKWARQLTAESLGKNGLGFTPTVSVGTTDLHSIAQLYLDGPDDKYAQFVFSGDGEKDKEIVFNAFKETVAAHGIPFSEFLFSKINEFEIGSYMQFKFFETLFLAKLLNVSPFGQPAVEEYKSKFS